MRNITRINQQGFIIGNNEVAALPDNIKVSNDFSYLDSNIKLSSQLGAKDRIEISGLWAQNDFSDAIVDNNRMEGQRDSMYLENRGLSLDWQHKWSTKWNSSLKVIGTEYNYEYEYNLKSFSEDKPRLFGVKENMIQDRQFSLTTNYQGQSNQKLSLGYHLIDYNINFKVLELMNANQGGSDEQGDSQSNLHSLFLSYNNPITNKLGLNIGLRSSYFNISKAIYLEPRIGAAYQLNKDFSFSANYGRHHQFVGQVTAYKGNNNGISFPLWALAEDRSIPIQQADLFQLGFIYKQRNWLFDLQIYGKEVKGLSSRAFNFEQVRLNTFAIGSSDTKGIDVLIKRKFNNFSSWVSYSYSRTDLLFEKISSETIPSDIDQGHTFQWTGQGRYKNLEFAIGFKLNSGLPYSTYSDFRILSPPGQPIEYEIEYDGINNARLATNHELNFSAQYQFGPNLASWKGFVSFSAINVLNKENVYTRTYYVDSPFMQAPTIQALDKTNLRFTPNLSLRFEW